MSPISRGVLNPIGQTFQDTLIKSYVYVCMLKYCLSTVNRLHSIENSRPNSSTLLLFYFSVIFLQTYWRSKQWKTSPGRSKTFPLIPGLRNIPFHELYFWHFQRISPSLAFTNIGLTDGWRFHFAPVMSQTCARRTLYSPGHALGDD